MFPKILKTLLIVAILSMSGGIAFGQAPAARHKIGTYDSRAIAIAWAASKFNPVSEKMKEYDAAKNANDTKKMKDLENWGSSHQRLLHFQGFGRVPVGELLLPVKDSVAKLAADKGLAAIAMSCDWTSPEVEVVDVTDDLVALFQPSERTLKSVREVRKVDPVSLLELADLPADK